MRKKPGRKARFGRFLLSMLILAAAALLGWNYLSPLLAAGSETVYKSYTAQTGDIQTSKSFAASINVLNSETHTNAREVTSIRKLYVQSGQQVRDGDKLLQLENGTIYRAGIDGTVNEMRFGEGDWVWPGIQLVQICDLTHLQVSLQVDEYDVDKVAAGQKCIVTIVALGLDFETEIKHVNRVSTASSGVAYYEVTAELTVPENVLPGMTASVSIPDDSVLGATVLDMAALSFNDEKQPYVLVKNGESYEERLIETGLTDGMHIEITSGLNAGDVVYRAEEQAVEAQPFSLASVYKKITGEKVVINDMSGGRQGGQMPQGMAPPEGFTMPEGAEPPEGFTMPEGAALPERPAVSGEEAASGRSEGRTQPSENQESTGGIAQ